MKFHVKACRIVNEPADRRMDFLKSFHILWGQNALIGHIQRHKRDRNPAVKDHVRGMRVNKNVELC